LERDAVGSFRSPGPLLQRLDARPKRRLVELQWRQLGRHAPVESGGRPGSPLRQRGRGLKVAIARLLFRTIEAGQGLGTAFEAAHPLLKRDEQRRQRGYGGVVLARDGTQRKQPLLDRLERAGLRLDAPGGGLELVQR